MNTIYLDGSLYQSRQAVFSALHRMLCFPEYDGMNADALHDLLCEMKEKPRFWLAHADSGEAAETIALVCRVAEDAGCEVVQLEG